MNGANLTGFIAAAAAVAAFSMAFASLRQMRAASRARVLFVLLIFAIPSALVAAYYAGVSAGIRVVL